MCTEIPDDEYDPLLDDPAALLAAEEPPGWLLEMGAREAAQQHRLEVHDGLVCDCPEPRCRVLGRVPRWFPGRGWRCGTPGLCGTARYPTPRAALRAHREQHEPPF